MIANPFLDVPDELLYSISQTDKVDALPKLSAPLLLPEYQANHIRFETLIHLTLVHSRGSKKLSRLELIRWLQLLRGRAAFNSEDPPEDVFVTSVATRSGNFRIFSGWKRSPDFYLQRLIDATTDNDLGRSDVVTSRIEALLLLSEAVAKRTGFESGLHTESAPQRSEWSLSEERWVEFGRAVMFSSAEVAALGIDAAVLDDFVLKTTGDLLSEPFGGTDLERRPFIRTQDSLHLLVPSAISSAIRLYLGEEISAGTISEAAMWNFHESLFQRWKVRDLPSADAYEVDTPPFPQINPNLFSMEAIFQFDQDKALHLVFLPSRAKPPGKNEIEFDYLVPRLSTQVTRHLTKMASTIEKTTLAKAGMSLVVFSSPGWTVKLMLPEDSGKWFYCATSASSLACLLGTKEFSILRFWKMLRHELQVRETGTALVMYPDILVHYSNWRSMHFSFFPRDTKACEKLGVALDTSNVAELVREWRQRSSAHAVQTVDGSWARCERLDKDSVTPQEQTKPIYVDAKAVALGGLRGVVETRQGTWWLTVPDPPADPDGRHFVYLLWHTGLDWLLRIARTSGLRMRSADQIVEVELDYSKESSGAAPCDSIRVTATSDPKKVALGVDSRFAVESQTAGNTGDRAYVRALIRSITMATGASVEQESLQGWVSEVVSDSAMKMIHVMPIHLSAFARPISRLQNLPRFLQEEDVAHVEFGFREVLADRVPNVETLEVIGDKNSVNELLNQAVASHWNSIRAEIESLDRLQLLNLLSSLIEGLHWNRLEWERSARAMLALHNDAQDFQMYVSSLMGRRDAALIAYRTLAEMAVCQAPLAEGRVPSLSDIDGIAAHCSRMVSIAYVSDACNGDLIQCKVSFSANGQIELPLDELHDLVNSYMHASLTHAFREHADSYESYFNNDDSILGSENFRRLDEAISAETKMSIADLVLYHFALDQVAHRLGSHVVSVRLSDLVSKVREINGSLTDLGLKKFLGAFALSTREAWDKVVKPFKRWEFEPWRFERRLSLNIRPVLIASTDDDPWIIYGVGQLHRAINYYFFLLDQGWWDPTMLTSETATAFVTEKNNQLGEEFERSVLAVLKQQGIDGKQGVPMTVLGGTEVQGDVDVLAWDLKSRILVVIECKRLKAARTPREIGNRLREFRGETGDRLNRHLERVRWIRANVEGVASRLNLSICPSRVRQLLVTDHPVPMAYREGLPVTAEDFATIRELRADLGRVLQN